MVFAVGQLDLLFTSRVQVVIRFSQLSIQDRNAIWDAYFRRLSSRYKNLTIGHGAIRYVKEDPDIRRLNWNAREIRNGKLHDYLENHC